MLKPTSTFLRSLPITSPAILVDEARARANIRRMAEKARTGGVLFRPHFKTHQSLAIGRWFRDEGVTAITVSSLEMAEHFAADGWNDITLAFLLNPLELPRLEALTERLGERGGALGVLIDSTATATALADSPTLRVWLKIDTGYGRTGIRWDDGEALRAVAGALGGKRRPAGLLTHAGQAYAVKGDEEILRIAAETTERMRIARAALGPGSDDLPLSIGDTPTCSRAAHFDGLDEIRPGNFVFYDLMQRRIGSCDDLDIALGLACPVVGLYPERGRIVIHGGAAHLSRESIPGSDERPLFGCLGAADGGLGRIIDRAPVVSLSQEHGVIEIAPDEFAALAGELEPGDLVLVLPVHSCLVCASGLPQLTLEGRSLPR